MFHCFGSIINAWGYTEILPISLHVSSAVEWFVKNEKCDLTFASSAFLMCLWPILDPSLLFWARSRKRRVWGWKWLVTDLRQRPLRKVKYLFSSSTLIGPFEPSHALTTGPSVAIILLANWTLGGYPKSLPNRKVSDESLGRNGMSCLRLATSNVLSLHLRCFCFALISLWHLKNLTLYYLDVISFEFCFLFELMVIIRVISLDLVLVNDTQFATALIKRRVARIILIITNFK